MEPKIRKLNFAEMGRTLTRAEMKEIIAGYGPGGGGGGGAGDGEICLYCFTPNGTECWYRNPPSSNPNADCQSIYPGYGGVYGYNGSPCNGCHMN